jgi:hypothetical protein
MKIITYKKRTFVKMAVSGSLDGINKMINNYFYEDKVLKVIDSNNLWQVACKTSNLFFVVRKGIRYYFVRETLDSVLDN